MNKWVQFVGQYGAEIRVPADKVLGLTSSGNDWESKVIGVEYKGPITFIYLGDHGGEEGSGWTVRGNIDEVQAKLDNTWVVACPINTLGVDPGAISALRYNQRQLDMDGVEVGVSRQALEEVLAVFPDLKIPS